VANPFKPSFGTQPPILVGRDSIIEDFRYGLRSGPGDPFRFIVFTGARGTGKSVMLSELGTVAASEGLICVRVNSGNNLLKQIVDRLLVEASELLDKPGFRLTGVNLPIVGGGITLEHEAAYEYGWSVQFEQLVKQLNSLGTGLYLALDEIHYSGIEQLRELFASIQTLISLEQNLAVAVAGLPHAVSDVLNDEVLTFLSRATQHTLAEVPIPEVTKALKQTINDNGRAISTVDLQTAAESSFGYPFMIQLVGYYCWIQNEKRKTISSGDVEEGIATAKRRLGSTIHSVTLKDLSRVDKTYLAYMASGETPVSSTEIAQRMGVSISYASQYRRRLIAAGVIEPYAHGQVDFAVPYLKDYLQEHIVSDYLDSAET